MALSQFLEQRFAPLGNTFLPEQCCNVQPAAAPDFADFRASVFATLVSRRSRSCSHSSVRLSPVDRLASARVRPLARLSHCEEGSGLLPGPTPSTAEASPPPTHMPAFADGARDAGADAIAEEDGGVTVMIRNLLRHAVQEVVLSMLERSGFAGLFELLYVPVEFTKGRRPASKGFSFVHMKSGSASRALVNQWHGTVPLGAGKAAKALNLSQAHLQGVRENLVHWNTSKTKRIRNGLYQPLLFDAEGRRMLLSDL